MTILQVIWFILIAVLWTGYLVLEGFGVGAGMVMPMVAKTDRERTQVQKTFGPVWDGNEVWLLTAGGATFAAFPEWYATMFSGMYLALFLILFSYDVFDMKKAMKFCTVRTILSIIFLAFLIYPYWMMTGFLR